MDKCACCQRPGTICAVTAGALGSDRGPASRQACGDCVPHVYGGEMQKDREHLQLWAAYVEHVQTESNTLVAVLRAEVDAKQAELEARPEKIVPMYIDAQELQEARDRADRAFQSRDRAYRTLIEIRVDHRELDSGRCRCGKRFDQCSVGQLLAGYAGLLGWERNQVERAGQGLHHRLPENHPSLVDPRWADTPRNEYVERDVLFTGPGYYASALVDELRDRGVDVREHQGREAGTTWTVPVAGPEEAIDDALAAVAQRHPDVRVRTQVPAD